MAVRAAVEALLRERKLDRTLTSALPERLGEDAVAPLDSLALDRALAGPAGLQGNAVAGGLPRGQVSEVVGPASSGRTSVAWAAIAAATRRGESVALIDTFDRFDPPTAHACGIDLAQLLWVRGQAVSKTSGAIDPTWLPGVRAVTGSPSRVLGAMGQSGSGTFLERVIDRAIKSLNLVVQSGVCTLVVMDLIDLPATALRRLPASTWFRVERAIDGSETAVLILAAQPVSRSSGGRSIVLSRGEGVVWTGDHDRSRRVTGVRSRATVNAARWSQGHTVVTETRLVNAV